MSVSLNLPGKGDFQTPVVSCKNISQQPLAGSVRSSRLSDTDSAGMFGLPNLPVVRCRPPEFRMEA